MLIKKEILQMIYKKQTIMITFTVAKRENHIEEMNDNYC